MTPAQASEVLELQRRQVALLEQLVSLLRPAHKDRKLHPKRFVARALGLSRSRLAQYLVAGAIATVRSGQLERVADEELQRLLREGLPELGPRHSRPTPSSPAPAKPTSEKPGNEIRALRLT